MNDTTARVDYQSFLRNKSQISGNSGFKPNFLPSFLIDFQGALDEWAIEKGRAAILADTGLGKTPMQLVWSENCVRHTNKPGLILAPLAVSAQTVRESEKFDIEAHQSRDGKVKPNITVTNYEQIDKFDPDDFSSVVLDEASAIKAFDGKRRKAITRFLSKIKYRLLCTATAAPNDFIELGTLSEALGEMPQSDMLSTFFLASDNKRHSLFKEGDFWNRAKWFLRAHAEKPFWRWVCSWARACRKPSDLGFDDSRFTLPPLNLEQHVIESEFCWPGELFPRIASTLKEQRIERKETMAKRCARVAELVAAHAGHSLVWCQYNEEGDILEKMISGARQVAGKNTDEEKEETVLWFAGNGKIGSNGHKESKRVLVTKPKVACWGLNFQACDHMTFFPSHSFEQFYQGVRRCWRYGQTRPVKVDIVTTSGEEGVTRNLEKKQKKADEMFAALVAEMRSAGGMKLADRHTQKMEVPQWL